MGEAFLSLVPCWLKKGEREKKGGSTLQKGQCGHQDAGGSDIL